MFACNYVIGSIYARTVSGGFTKQSESNLPETQIHQLSLKVDLRDLHQVCCRRPSTSLEMLQAESESLHKDSDILLTCKVNIDRTVSFSLEDRYDGMLGIRPELTIVVSSGWLRAVANGDLGAKRPSVRGIDFTFEDTLTHDKVHSSKIKHPKLHMSDLVSYRFSCRISGGM
jgi:hypothetical protein